jgi:surface antigen
MISRYLDGRAVSWRLIVPAVFLLLLVAASAGATPPPWAPAHGYRNKHPQPYYYDYEDQYYEDDDYLPWLKPGHYSDFLGGGRCNREKLGAVLGGVLGGVAGSRVGDGKGKTVATITGTVIGILVGQSIGRYMDETDQYCTGQTLEYAPDKASVSWRDPDTGSVYQVTPVRTYQSAAESYCREYLADALIGGRRQQVYGTACRQPDGSWQRR